METSWENEDRVNAINQALNRIPHDQYATGLGIRLSHNPENCTRCKATIAILEIASILEIGSNIEGEIGYDDLGNQILVSRNDT